MYKFVHFRSTRYNEEKVAEHLHGFILSHYDNGTPRDNKNLILRPIVRE